LVLHTKYILGEQIEKNEMDGACSAYGERRGVYRVLVGKPEGKRPLGIVRRRWRIILRWIFKKWDLGVWIWVYLALSKDMWRVRVNAVRDFRVP
jgi:hypothetical protein